MYDHKKDSLSRKKQCEEAVNESKRKPKGWRGKRIAEKAGGQETAAKRLGDEVADGTTPGVTLAAPVGSQEDDGESANFQGLSPIAWSCPTKPKWQVSLFGCRCGWAQERERCWVGAG